MVSTLIRQIPHDFKYWRNIVALALVYFLAARVGFLFPFEGEIATLVWPASGVALTAILLFGLDLWPAVTLGSLLVAISNGHSLQLTLGVILAHTLEAYVGAYILTQIYLFRYQT